MKNSERMGDLNTILGKGSSFEGTLVVDHSLRIDGSLKGKIKASDTLVVGKEGQVDGTVTVKNLTVGGKMKGNITVIGKTVLESKAEFAGELKTSKLVIDEGAMFDGSCSMSNVNTGSVEQNNSNKVN